MAPLADPQILAQFVAVLDNWNVSGYVTAKEVVDWMADNLPGHDLRGIAKLIHDHLQAGEGRIRCVSAGRNITIAIIIMTSACRSPGGKGRSTSKRSSWMTTRLIRLSIL